MKTTKIRKILRGAAEALKSDPEWVRGQSYSQIEVVGFVRKNHPEIVKNLGELDFNELQDKGFMAAIFMFAPLMKNGVAEV